MKGWIKNNKDAWDATISVYDEELKQSIRKPDVFKRLYLLDTGEYDNAKTESRKQELKKAAKERQLSPDIIYTKIVKPEEQKEKEQGFSPRQELAIQYIKNYLKFVCPEKTCDKENIYIVIDEWQDPVRFPYKVIWKDFLPFCIPLSPMFYKQP